MQQENNHAHTEGGREVKLHEFFNALMRAMQRYALAPQNYYMQAIKG